LGKITISPNIILNEQVDKLLDELHTHWRSYSAELIKLENQLNELEKKLRTINESTESFPQGNTLKK